MIYLATVESIILSPVNLLLQFAILIFISVPACGQTFDLGGGLSVTQDQLDEIRAQLPKLEEDQTFYHWADEKRAWRWVKQGHVDQGEMDFLNKPSVELQAYGPGLYLSNNPTSSESFGNVPTAIEMKAGTPLYDENVITKVLGKPLTSLQSAKLGSHINFVKSISTADGWFLTNNAANTTHVSYAGRFDASAKKPNAAAKLQKIIAELGKEDPQKYGYLASLIHLMNYQDGVSFVHSLAKNPANPWAEFDPDHFETYRQTAERAFSDLADGKSFGMAKSGSFLGQSDPKAWAQHLVEVFEDLHHQALGQPKGNYRTSVVVGGGDVEGGYAYATESQLKELDGNVYLQIESVKDPSSPYYRVKIKYPNIEDYSRLSQLVSPEFREEIEKHGDLSKLSSGDRDALQKKFLKSLVENRLRLSAGKPFDEGLYRDLVAIHPFDDGNGRTVHLMQRIGSVEAGEKMPYFSISDLDLLTSPKLQADLLRKSGKAYEKWLGDLLSEAQQAAQQNRIPRLVEYPHRDRVAESMEGLSAKPTWTEADFGQIERREWAPLLNKWIGPNWQRLYEATPLDFMEHPNDFIKEGSTISDLTARIREYIADMVEAKDKGALATALQKTDKRFLPLMVDVFNQAASKYPDLMRTDFYKLTPRLWEELKEKNQLGSLPQSSIDELIIHSLGIIPEDHISESQLIRAIHSIPKSSNVSDMITDLASGLQYSPYSKAKPASPEIKDAIDKLFDQDLGQLRSIDRKAFKNLFVESLENGVAGPSGKRFFETNYSLFSTRKDFDQLYFGLEKVKGSPAGDEMIKFAVDKGLKDLKNDPLKYLNSSTFLNLANATPFNKRQLVMLIQGVRNSDGEAKDFRWFLNDKSLSNSDLDLFERELEKVISRKKTPNEYFYAVLNTLIKRRPDSAVIDSVERATKDPVDFFRKTHLWTKRVEDRFLNEPSQFSKDGDATAIVDAVKSLKQPSERVGEVLKKLVDTNSDHAKSVTEYAAKLDPKKTVALDDYISANPELLLKNSAVADYARLRPFVMEKARQNLSLVDVVDRAGDVSPLLKDDPLTTKAFLQEAEKRITSATSLYDSARGAAFWQVAKSLPEHSMTEAQHNLFVRHFGNPDEVVKMISKGPREFQEWQALVSESLKRNRLRASRLIDEVAAKLMDIPNPPSFIRELLADSMSKSEGIGDRLRQLYDERNQLNDWQKDVYKKAVQKMSTDARFHEAFNLQYYTIKTKARAELAEIFVKNGKDLVTEIKANLKFYDHLGKTGIQIDTTQQPEIEKIVEHISKGDWSKTELGWLLGRNPGAFESMIKLSSLSPERQKMVLNTKNERIFESSLKSRAVDADLVDRIVKGHGNVSKNQLESWVKHGTCANGMTRFFRRVGEITGL